MLLHKQVIPMGATFGQYKDNVYIYPQVYRQIDIFTLHQFLYPKFSDIYRRRPSDYGQSQ